MSLPPLFHLRLGRLLGSIRVLAPLSSPRLAAPARLVLGSLPLVAGGYLGLGRSPVAGAFRVSGGFLLVPGELPPALASPSPLAPWLSVLVALLAPPPCLPFASFSELPGSRNSASPGPPS